MSALERVTTLRAGIDPHSDALAMRELYEHWLQQERWPLHAALALIVGVDPAGWSAHLVRPGHAAAAQALLAQLSADLGLTAAAEVDVLRLRAWARSAGVRLPHAGAELLDYIARTVPAPPLSGMRTDAGTAAEQVAVLGAALALATRFTEQCLDQERRFDSRQMVLLMRAQAAVWFGDTPPDMNDAAIAALLDRYLHSA